MRLLETPSIWRHNGAMPSIQIKNVPPEVHAILSRRAAEAHQSLQEYLRARLIAEASEPTMTEIFDRIERHEDGRVGGSISPDEAAETIRSLRDSR